MTNLLKYRRWSWLLLLIPVYLFLFLKLGSTHIRLWDESWFTVHAIEMLQNGSLLVSYFDGVPSYTASKPPLQTWLQMASISLFGIGELSLRFPSAVAAALTVFLLFWVLKKNQGLEMAWMASMVLLTSVGFIGFHTARGAEADALLTLILLGQTYAFYNFVQSKNRMWLLWCSALVGVGFLTKSVAGFLMLPGFALYTLLFERVTLPSIFMSWQFYAGIILILFIVGGYLIARDSVQPGYMDMVFRSNAGRYTQSVGHDRAWHFYIMNMFTERYIWWMILAIIGLALSLLQENALFKYTAVVVLTYLVVISFSRSKLEWYDMPLYPLLAISSALGIKTVVKEASAKLKPVLIVSIFIFPTYNMFNRVQANTLNLQEMEYESQEILLTKAFRSGTDLNGTKIISDHFHGSLLFYKHMLAEYGTSVTIQNHTSGLEDGDMILIKGKDHKKETSAAFLGDTIRVYRDAALVRLKERRTH